MTGSSYYLPTSTTIGQLSAEIMAGNTEPDYADHVIRIALPEIGDTPHAGGSHPGPGGVERARQIDRPAPGLDQDGVEA
jgi:hypothetical protein